ncbi:MAG: hypothetical protein IKI11_02625 [Neisseriaceae bacterium]|nr:hypothetical protein [Neisseriaceae bacterium]
MFFNFSGSLKIKSKPYLKQQYLLATGRLQICCPERKRWGLFCPTRQNIKWLMAHCFRLPEKNFFLPLEIFLIATIYRSSLNVAV